MRKRLWPFALCLVAALAAQAGDTPYLTDRFVAEFATYATPRTVPVTLRFVSVSSGEERSGSCTAPLVYANDTWLYGLIAAHCVSDDAPFIFRGAYVRGDKIELLDYYRAPNETRIWKVRQGHFQKGQLVHLASHPWLPGVRSFVIGYRHHLQEFEAFYTTGYVQTFPGVKLRYFGDLSHSAGALGGFSGGGTFFYNERERRFELVGITVAVSVYSSFTFAYSTPPDLFEIIARDLQGVAAAPAATAAPSQFANWGELPAELQAAWQTAYVRNESYKLDLTPGRYAVLVNDVTWGIGPQLVVARAFLQDRLRAQGRLQEVDWSAFNWEPR